MSSDDRQIIPLAAKRAEIIIHDSELGVLGERPPTQGQAVLLARAVRALVAMLVEGTEQISSLTEEARVATSMLEERQAIALTATTQLKFAQQEHLPSGWYWTTSHAEARHVDEKSVCKQDRGSSLQEIGMVPVQVSDAVRARSGRKASEVAAKLGQRART